MALKGLVLSLSERQMPYPVTKSNANQLPLTLFLLSLDAMDREMLSAVLEYALSWKVW